MKTFKYLFTLGLSAFLFAACSQAKLENTKVVTEENQVSKTALMVELCKKHLGEENYYFINELYNDKDAALNKCKEELGL